MITIKTATKGNFEKPAAGQPIEMKLVAIVNHGLVKATVPGYKDQDKFTMIFATRKGFQVSKEVSATWGDKSGYRKFLKQWVGKDSEQAPLPSKLLGWCGFIVLEENGEYLNLSSIFGIKKDTTNDFPTQVWISDYLRTKGAVCELEFAEGVTEKTQTSADQRTESKLAANAGIAQQSVNMNQAVQSQAQGLANPVQQAQAVATAPVVNVSEDDLPF